VSERRVIFYVLAGAEERDRFKFGCKLVERAYLAGEHVLVWFDEPLALGRFDELLWTYADRSFVPHETFADASQWQDTPVLLSCGTQPEQPFEVLVNFGDQVPPAAERAVRIVELIDADENRRRAGRNRFRQYREQGLTPETHTVSGEELP
jgi:DNA polymerase-3 subunit chi